VRSSRLIVRNLPKHLTDKRLREHFGAKGEVTDVRIMKTREGKSRQFGFVGFKSEAQAKAARHHFHETYIDTSRVTVEMAVQAGDAQLGRPWSKHSAGSGRRAPSADDRAAPDQRERSSVTIDLGGKTDTAKLLAACAPRPPRSPCAPDLPHPQLLSSSVGLAQCVQRRRSQAAGVHPGAPASPTRPTPPQSGADVAAAARRTSRAASSPSGTTTPRPPAAPTASPKPRRRRARSA